MLATGVVRGQTNMEQFWHHHRSLSLQLQNSSSFSNQLYRNCQHIFPSVWHGCDVWVVIADHKFATNPRLGKPSFSFWTSDFENEDILRNSKSQVKCYLGVTGVNPKKRKNHLAVPWCTDRSLNHSSSGILFESSRPSFSKDCWEGNLWARTALVKSFLISSWFESHKENQSPRSNLYNIYVWQWSCWRDGKEDVNVIVILFVGTSPPFRLSV